jgi:hypothetical protein
VNARRVLARILLAFLLLASQQLGMAHTIAHFSADSSASHKKPLPAELQCERCLAFAAIGSALTGAPPTFSAPAATTGTTPALPTFKPLPSALRAFDSRAPPLSSL